MQQLVEEGKCSGEVGDKLAIIVQEAQERTSAEIHCVALGHPLRP